MCVGDKTGCPSPTRTHTRNQERSTSPYSWKSTRASTHKRYTDSSEMVQPNDIVVCDAVPTPFGRNTLRPRHFQGWRNQFAENIVWTQSIIWNQLARQDKAGIFLQQPKKVMFAAVHAESFPPFLQVIKIGFGCQCTSTTQCGFFTHHTLPRPRVLTPGVSDNAITRQNSPILCFIANHRN